MFTIHGPNSYKLLAQHHSITASQHLPFLGALTGSCANVDYPFRFITDIGQEEFAILQMST